MKVKLLLLLSFSLLNAGMAQVTDPMITSWWFNTTNQYFTGTNGTTLVDVEAVYYTTSLVYVKSSGIPNYYADGQSNFDAKDMTNVYQLPRTQTVGTSVTRTSIINEGAVGVFIDGSAALSPGDGKTYNSLGVWHQLAYKFEGLDFDATNGHSTPQGQYHHHVDPNTLYDVSASSVHSPVIGYAFDGYPIYGPYGYTNVNGTGAIKRMTSSWQTRSITVRTILPDGSTASSSGPAVGMPPTNQPIGKYWEDYTYTSASGDLDRHNGRFCITPEYPSGTYCYFITLDSNLDPYFPYIIGDSLYGVVQSGNTGPTGGNNTVPGSATLYSSISLGLDEFTNNENSDFNFDNVKIWIFPNPVVSELTVSVAKKEPYKVNLYSADGIVLRSGETSSLMKIDMSKYAKGNYVVEVVELSTGNGYMKRVVKE